MVRPGCDAGWTISYELYDQDDALRTMLHPPGLAGHAISNHPFEELFQGVCPVGRSGIRVVTLALLVPNQHRFTGVIAADSSKLRSVLNAWKQSDKPSEVRLDHPLTQWGRTAFEVFGPVRETAAPPVPWHSGLRWGLRWAGSGCFALIADAISHERRQVCFADRFTAR